MGNTFGTIFKLTTFGESHGKAIGGVIDGCPAGLKVDFEKIQHQSIPKGNSRPLLHIDGLSPPDEIPAG